MGSWIRIRMKTYADPKHCFYQKFKYRCRVPVLSIVASFRVYNLVNLMQSRASAHWLVCTKFFGTKRHLSLANCMRAGLGADRPGEIGAEDDEFDAYRKRMMLAYRFRPNPLVGGLRTSYTRHCTSEKCSVTSAVFQTV